MKILCIGRNYVDHAKELNNEVPSEPVVFMKPESSILQGKIFNLPTFSSNIHYECELVLKIGKTGKNILEKDALDYISEISIGLDLTARDLQSKQKEKSLPWEIAKAFDGSTVLGDFIPFKNEELYTFDLYKNEEKVQEGNPELMIFNYEKIIAYCSQFFTLEEGDLIFTGTPKGVGQLKTGDILEGQLLKNNKFKLTIR